LKKRLSSRKDTGALLFLHFPHFTLAIPGSSLALFLTVVSSRWTVSNSEGFLKTMTNDDEHDDDMTDMTMVAT